MNTTDTSTKRRLIRVNLSDNEWQLLRMKALAENTSVETLASNLLRAALPEKALPANWPEDD